jgi:hypothetical protein
LHLSAGSTTADYHKSAKTKLGERFQDVQRRHENLCQLETDAQSRVNAGVLKRWKEGGVGWGTDEKIQCLDAVLSGVWNASEPGGKYSRIVRKFERWIGVMEEVLEERENHDSLYTKEVRFLAGMEVSWREDCEALNRKLDGWGRQLTDIGDVDDVAGNSSLGVVARGISTLIYGMSRELSVMRDIERKAMEKEEEWIREVNDDLSDEEEGRLDGPAWRLR